MTNKLDREHFTPVQNVRKTRNSGFFNFLTAKKELVRNAGASRTKFTPEYILIPMVLSDLRQDLQGYIPTEWHIRIDSSYKIQSKFLAHWHQTIIVKDGVNIHNIHIYYHHSIFLHATLNRKKITDSELIQSITNACVPGLNLVLQLLEHFNERKEYLHKQLEVTTQNIHEMRSSGNILKRDLDDLFASSQQVYDELIEIDEHFPQTFIVNLKQTIELLKKKAIRNRETTTTNDFPITNTQTSQAQLSTGASKATQLKHTQPKSNKALSKTREQLKAITNIFDNYGNVIKAINDLKHLKAIIEAQDHNDPKIEDIYLDILIQEARLPNIFVELIKRNKLEIAKELHTVVVDNLTILHFAMIFAHLCNMGPIIVKNQASLAGFLSYLYERDDNYRSNLTSFFSSFIISRLKYKEGNRETLIENGRSILLMLVQNNNQLIFVTIYRQLNRDHFIGHYCGNRACDILLSLSYYHHNDLIIRSLNLGIKESPKLPADMNVSSPINRQPIKIVTSNKVSPIDALAEAANMMGVTSVFYHFCNNNGLSDNLLEMAKNTDNLHLALGLSFLLTRVRGSILIPNSTSNIQFNYFVNPKVRLDFARQLGDGYLHSEHNSISFLLLVDNSEQMKLLSVITKILTDRLSTISTEQGISLMRDAQELFELEMKQNRIVRNHNFIFIWHFTMIILTGLVNTIAENAHENLLGRIEKFITHFEQCVKDKKDTNLPTQILLEIPELEQHAASYKNLLRNFEMVKDTKISKATKSTLMTFKKPAAYRKVSPEKEEPTHSKLNHQPPQSSRKLTFQ